jgi:hypothetical protein
MHARTKHVPVISVLSQRGPVHRAITPDGRVFELIEAHQVPHPTEKITKSILCEISSSNHPQFAGHSCLIDGSHPRYSPDHPPVLPSWTPARGTSLGR